MSEIHLGKTDFLKIARYMGAVDCIRKPFAPDDIIRIVNLTLDGHGNGNGNGNDKQV